MMVTEMTERSTTLMGEEPASKTIEDIDVMKATIVEQLTACGVSFPIKTKEELGRIYPKGTPIKCMYNGKETSIHELIDRIDSKIFPLQNPGDTATALVSQCQIER